MCYVESDQANWYKSDKTNLGLFSTFFKLLSIAWRGRANLKKKYSIKADMLFFANTPNQFATNAKIAEELSTDCVIEKMSEKPHFATINHGWAVPEFYALFALPFVAIASLFTVFNKRVIIWPHLYEHALSTGYFLFYYRIFKRNRHNIKLGFVSNDHNFYVTSFIKALQLNEIPVAYTQHAQIGDCFPKLQFDYSFLSGNAAFEMYTQQQTTEGAIFFTGAVLFDHLNYQPTTTLKTIGMGIGATDKRPLVEDCILKLKAEGYRVILRPHPAIDVNLWEGWAKEQGVIFSAARKQPLMEFLAETDAVFTSESTLILEVFASGKIGGIVDFDWGYQRDYYGFEASGIVNHYFSNAEEVIDFLKEGNITEELQHAQQYIVKYDAIHPFRKEWNSAKLMAQLCETIIHQKDLTLNGFFEPEVQKGVTCYTPKINAI